MKEKLKILLNKLFSIVLLPISIIKVIFAKKKIKKSLNERDFDTLCKYVKFAEENGLLIDTQLNYANEIIINLTNAKKLSKRVSAAKVKSVED